ncbi:MAG: flagellar protein FhlB [Alphaproteobacteria bacterium]|nr:flagellar protein FhlB [Alphaproteobacteria bacterium]
MDDDELIPSPFGPLRANTPKRQKAVALEYDKSKAPVPRIVASGQGHIAEQIMAIAFANGIKVREDADLIEVLSVMEVDSLIPLETYQAVGEILSYVYRANGQAMKLKVKRPSAQQNTLKEGDAS